MVLGDSNGSQESTPLRNSALSTTAEGDATEDDEGASRVAHRPFQYKHRSLFAYYAIVMSGVTILESFRLDARHLFMSSKTSGKMRKKSWFGNHGRSRSSNQNNIQKDSASMWTSAQCHLAYGLGFGIASHGQGIVRNIITTQAQCKHLGNRIYLVLKSMKQFVAQSYPVGITMYVRWKVLSCCCFTNYFTCGRGDRLAFSSLSCGACYFCSNKSPSQH